MGWNWISFLIGLVVGAVLMWTGAIILISIEDRKRRSKGAKYGSFN